MDILNHPMELTIAILLSVISTVLCWKAWSGKDYFLFLLGVGVGIPTVDMENWKLWVFAAVVCYLAVWLKRKFEAV